MMKAITLLSGGLDSTLCTVLALRDMEVILALTVDYGQKARTREVESAGRIAAFYNIPHRVVEAGFLRTFASGLTRAERSTRSSREVWVPNRNGLFINIAACYAEEMGAEAVLVGFNREEAVDFPDNSPDFVSAVNRSLSYSTRNQVRVISYTMEMDKTEMLREAIRLGIPLHYTWSCYEDGPSPCGVCASCRLLAKARENLDLRATDEHRPGTQLKP
ncbi:7-cyano-7-deazaguanine synthase QueC [Syntrophothermus lipocalidus]|uniref:7-cyano-7-deazaguanine synthase n=1 Tax=Syntrophothermus lipocalidus (strain DSM 12680 / TGB-C1) TaxID=643648 RepID=D7CMQ2_SYNLT|nr:7-cyano-7-deazaguanine synthase QueC [Syntrophothermus lipocalidus]ADI01987.1 exsB protein [Syntrophothermus lipocalidus DSM 12680]